MVRGYQKRVIFLKNTGSKLFEEAYFVLSDDAAASGVGREGMLEEANRILANSSLVSGPGTRKISTAVRRILPAVLSVALGIAIGIAGTLLVLM